MLFAQTFFIVGLAVAGVFGQDTTNTDGDGDAGTFPVVEPDPVVSADFYCNTLEGRPIWNAGGGTDAAELQSFCGDNNVMLTIRNPTTSVLYDVSGEVFVGKICGASDGMLLKTLDLIPQLPAEMDEVIDLSTTVIQDDFLNVPCGPVCLWATVRDAGPATFEVRASVVFENKDRNCVIAAADLPNLNLDVTWNLPADAPVPVLEIGKPIGDFFPDLTGAVSLTAGALRPQHPMAPLLAVVVIRPEEFTHEDVRNFTNFEWCNDATTAGTTGGTERRKRSNTRSKRQSYEEAYPEYYNYGMIGNRFEEWRHRNPEGHDFSDIPDCAHNIFDAHDHVLMGGLIEIDGAALATAGQTVPLDFSNVILKADTSFCYPGEHKTAELMVILDPLGTTQDTNLCNNAARILVNFTCPYDMPHYSSCSLTVDPNSNGHVAQVHMAQWHSMIYDSDGFTYDRHYGYWGCEQLYRRLIQTEQVRFKLLEDFYDSKEMSISDIEQFETVQQKKQIEKALQEVDELAQATGGATGGTTKRRKRSLWNYFNLDADPADLDNDVFHMENWVHNESWNISVHDLINIHCSLYNLTDDVMNEEENRLPLDLYHRLQQLVIYLHDQVMGIKYQTEDMWCSPDYDWTPADPYVTELLERARDKLPENSDVRKIVQGAIDKHEMGIDVWDYEGGDRLDFISETYVRGRTCPLTLPKSSTGYLQRLEQYVQLVKKAENADMELSYSLAESLNLNKFGARRLAMYLQLGLGKLLNHDIRPLLPKYAGNYNALKSLFLQYALSVKQKMDEPDAPDNVDDIFAAVDELMTQFKANSIQSCGGVDRYDVIDDVMPLSWQEKDGVIYQGFNNPLSEAVGEGQFSKKIWIPILMCQCEDCMVSNWADWNHWTGEWGYWTGEWEHWTGEWEHWTGEWEHWTGEWGGTNGDWDPTFSGGRRRRK